MLDKKIKTKILLVIFLMIIGEIIAITPLFRVRFISTQTWLFSLGWVGIVSSIAFLYIMTIIPFDKKNRLIRLAILANPGAAMFLAGLSLVSGGYEQFNWTSITFGLLAILSFFISFGLLMRYFAARNDK